MTLSNSKRTLLTLLLLAGMAGLAGCGGPINTSLMTSRELMDLGMEKYQKEKYIRATELFQAVVFNYPGEAMVDSAQFYLGLSYYGNHDYALGGVEFNRLLLNYPSSVFAIQAQLLKAVCFFESTPKHYGLDQSDLEFAIRQFEDFIVDYPESESIAEAKSYLSIALHRMAKKYYRSGVVYSRIKAHHAAEVYYQKVIDDYTDTEFAPFASYQIAEGNYHRKKWAEAQEGFENFVIVFPDHEWSKKATERSCQAAFKNAVQAFEDGDFAEAEIRFERSKINCMADQDRIKKIDDYLRRIGEVNSSGTQEEHAGP